MIIGHEKKFSIEDFYRVVFEKERVALDDASGERLDEARGFIDYLLANNVQVYGLTTGFADLRRMSVSPKEAGQLSKNIILSHDAAIGAPIPLDIVRGAMLIHARSLSQGFSGFQKDSLNTLIDMINAHITPEVNCTGSLGACGDLALLARVGRAMSGDPNVYVHYKERRMPASEALKEAGIKPFEPAAKEGLALTNGTSFMASSLAIGFLKQLHLYENILGLFTYYLSATKSIDAAFYDSIHNVRKQKGQAFVASILSKALKDSPLLNRTDVQNDYSQRCIPALFGPKIENFFLLADQVFTELNAVTDNPLIFRGEEISSDVAKNRIVFFDNMPWTVISGGNFHGEVIATVADTLSSHLAKIALLMERELTFLNNPSRNGQFPAYLIVNESQTGLQSGFMIPQYVANALTQKICALADPVSKFNITSANESEDVVSYGNAACEKWLQQLDLFEQLLAVYLTVASQAYSIARKNTPLDPELASEKIFSEVTALHPFPIEQETAFNHIYPKMTHLLKSGKIRRIMQNPLSTYLNIPEMIV